MEDLRGIESVLKPNLADDVISRYGNMIYMEDFREFILGQNLYSAAIKEVSTKLQILDDEFQVKYSHNPIHHMECRLKSPKSIIEKLQRKNLEVSAPSIRNNLTDIAGVRVVCNYVEDIYRIAALLINQDDVTLVRKRDYVMTPKENGYRSLHLIVSVPIYLSDTTENVNVEIQIRTIAMDFWASLEHKLKYKSEGDVSSHLKQRLKACAESIHQIDMEMQEIWKLENRTSSEQNHPRKTIGNPNHQPQHQCRQLNVDDTDQL